MRAVLAALLLLACRGGTTVDARDSRLKLSGGRWLFQGAPLTGTIAETLPDAIRLTAYVAGVEDGIQTTTMESGVQVEERFFKEGKKHGVHRGWFPDGHDRFYTEFEGDHYSGEHWSWHANGKVAEYKKYATNGQILVHKHWRESGQVYRNQVFVKNSELGFPGVKLCNTVKESVTGRK